MSKLKDDLDDIAKNKKQDRHTINSLVLQQKFTNMFSCMREDRHLDEVRTGLHASAIIGSDNDFCYRQQVLSLLFKQDQGKELPPTLLRIFAAGNSIHEKWQNIFEKISGNMKGFELVKNEARSFDERYDLYFTPDAQAYINNEEYIIEIKSMNTFSFKHTIGAKDPHPSGRKQLQLYMFLRGVSKGILILEDKNDQKFTIVRIDFNHEEVIPYVERLNEIQIQKKDFLEKDIEPIGLCKKSTCKRATDCSMYSACFNVDKREKIK